MLVHLSSRGQLVIPKAIRQALGLRTGTQFHIRLDESRIILEPMAKSPVEALYGKYANADFLTDLEAEHKQEIQNDTKVRA